MIEETLVEVNLPIITSLELGLRQAHMEYCTQNNIPIYLQKGCVDRYGGLKIYIYSNEHPPPHFRVYFQESTADFRISDCKCIAGTHDMRRYEKKIYGWWVQNKTKLINYWNENRPTDCNVGPYREQ